MITVDEFQQALNWFDSPNVNQSQVHLRKAARVALILAFRCGLRRVSQGAVMVGSSRRGFLKAASSTAAAMAIARGFRPGQPVRKRRYRAAAGPVKVWSTFREQRHSPGEPLAWKPSTEIAADAIALDPTSARQEMLGLRRCHDRCSLLRAEPFIRRRAPARAARHLRARRDGH